MPPPPPPSAVETGLLLPPCASAPDTDADGIGDACELELARAFAPMLVVDSSACDWDTSVEPARLGGEYYFGVQAPANDTIRIAYLPAYYLDCGWSGPKCLLPGAGCEGHTGDSELIVLEVARGAQRWRTEAVFLSAHCFGRGRDCRWYRGPELERFRWRDDVVRGAPVVYAARGTHAAYPSRAACDRGHFFLDTCDRNDVDIVYPIRSGRQNVGSAAVPVGEDDGCVTAEHVGWGSRRPVRGSVECLWSPTQPFRGWQARAQGDAPTPYGRYLREIAGFGGA